MKEPCDCGPGTEHCGRNDCTQPYASRLSITLSDFQRLYAYVHNIGGHFTGRMSKSDYSEHETVAKLLEKVRNENIVAGRYPVRHDIDK